jgi:hypothetical protein
VIQFLWTVERIDLTVVFLNLDGPLADGAAAVVPAPGRVFQLL